MTAFQRETRVEAPLEEVWAFQSTVDGLRVVTPDFMNLRVHGVVGPDGESDPAVLDEGTQLRLSIRPFGAGPRQRWTSVVIERRQDDGAAVFRDRMVEGPFPAWEHTHQFFADDGGTEVVDRVEYQLPGGPFGRLVSPLGVVGLAPLFRARHRRTRAYFDEDGGTKTSSQ